MFELGGMPLTLKATFGDEALSFDMDGRTLNLPYADCEQAEDAGGLIYIWPRKGVPIVVPTRALADAEERRVFPPIGSIANDGGGLAL